MGRLFQSAYGSLDTDLGPSTDHTWSKNVLSTPVFSLTYTKLREQDDKSLQKATAWQNVQFTVHMVDVGNFYFTRSFDVHYATSSWRSSQQQVWSTKRLVFIRFCVEGDVIQNFYVVNSAVVFVCVHKV